MKRLLLIIPILFLAIASYSQSGLRSPSFVGSLFVASSGSGDICSSCTNETFEGTGTSVAGWVYGDGSAGVVTNIDYTTAPAPLDGSQSLLLKDTAGGGGAYIYLNMPNSTEVWGRFMLTITNTIVNQMRVVWVADNAFGELAQVQVQSSGLRIVCGTANATTVSTLTAGTLYYVWWHYKKGTGANAIADVAFSTTKVRPTAGNGFAQVTTGTKTANAQQCGPFVIDVNFTGAVSGMIFDKWSMTTISQPGDFP